MKSICALLFVLSLCLVVADAQSDKAPVTTPASLPSIDQWSLSGVVTHPEQTPLLTLKQKPNELRLGKMALSGIAVEVVKVDNSFQLFNPWAPPEYGESQDNATFSLITNQVTGWKLFAFEF